MKSVEEAINDLQCRALAYEVIFQSIYAELPGFIKDKTLENIQQKFKAFDAGTPSEAGKAKLEATKDIIARITGAKL
ncbi:hypothetical protein [Atlantibacter sp.]|uniref:hypothetical protein n=1 Tax=Atlantibacter sp. TaxID=1903473 RepID=UPI0013EF6772|nr:hypothetical protein [Atlantibacter sp.]